MFSTLLFLSSAAAAHLQATPGGRLVVEPGSFGPEVEIELQQRCGSQCVAELRRFSAEYNGTLLADALVRYGNSTLEGLQGFASEPSPTARVQKVLARANAGAHASSLQVPPIGDGTGCASDALCSIKNLVANACNYGRAAMQATYQGVNVVVHVMGVLITALCGCLNVLTTAVCVLQSVPPTCQLPYRVFGKLWTASIQLWEATKGSTQMCMMHATPLFPMED